VFVVLFGVIQCSISVLFYISVLVFCSVRFHSTVVCSTMEFHIFDRWRWYRSHCWWYSFCWPCCSPVHDHFVPTMGDFLFVCSHSVTSVFLRHVPRFWMISVCSFRFRRCCRRWHSISFIRFYILHFYILLYTGPTCWFYSTSPLGDCSMFYHSFTFGWSRCSHFVSGPTYSHSGDFDPVRYFWSGVRFPVPTRFICLISFISTFLHSISSRYKPIWWSRPGPSTFPCLFISCLFGPRSVHFPTVVPDRSHLFTISYHSSFVDDGILVHFPTFLLFYIHCCSGDPSCCVPQVTIPHSHSLLILFDTFPTIRCIPVRPWNFLRFDLHSDIVGAFVHSWVDSTYDILYTDLFVTIPFVLFYFIRCDHSLFDFHGDLFISRSFLVPGGRFHRSSYHLFLPTFDGISVLFYCSHSFVLCSVTFYCPEAVTFHIYSFLLVTVMPTILRWLHSFFCSFHLIPFPTMHSFPVDSFTVLDISSCPVVLLFWFDFDFGDSTIASFRYWWHSVVRFHIPSVPTQTNHSMVFYIRALAFILRSFIPTSGDVVISWVMEFHVLPRYLYLHSFFVVRWVVLRCCSFGDLLRFSALPHLHFIFTIHSGTPRFRSCTPHHYTPPRSTWNFLVLLRSHSLSTVLHSLFTFSSGSRFLFDFPGRSVVGDFIHSIHLFVLPGCLGSRSFLPTTFHFTVFILIIHSLPFLSYKVPVPSFRFVPGRSFDRWHSYRFRRYLFISFRCCSFHDFFLIHLFDFHYIHSTFCSFMISMGPTSLHSYVSVRYTSPFYIPTFLGFIPGGPCWRYSFCWFHSCSTMEALPTFLHSISLYTMTVRSFGPIPTFRRTTFGPWCSFPGDLFLGPAFAVPVHCCSYLVSLHSFSHSGCSLFLLFPGGVISHSWISTHSYRSTFIRPVRSYHSDLFDSYLHHCSWFLVCSIQYSIHFYIHLFGLPIRFHRHCPHSHSPTIRWFWSCSCLLLVFYLGDFLPCSGSAFFIRCCSFWRYDLTIPHFVPGDHSDSLPSVVRRWWQGLHSTFGTVFPRWYSFIWEMFICYLLFDDPVVTVFLTRCSDSCLHWFGIHSVFIRYFIPVMPWCCPDVRNFHSVRWRYSVLTDYSLRCSFLVTFYGDGDLCDALLVPDHSAARCSTIRSVSISRCSVRALVLHHRFLDSFLEYHSSYCSRSTFYDTISCGGEAHWCIFVSAPCLLFHGDFLLHSTWVLRSARPLDFVPTSFLHHPLRFSAAPSHCTFLTCCILCHFPGLFVLLRFLQFPGISLVDPYGDFVFCSNFVVLVRFSLFVGSFVLLRIVFCSTVTTVLFCSPIYVLRFISFCSLGVHTSISSRSLVRLGISTFYRSLRSGVHFTSCSGPTWAGVPVRPLRCCSRWISYHSSTFYDSTLHPTWVLHRWNFPCCRCIPGCSFYHHTLFYHLGSSVRYNVHSYHIFYIRPISILSLLVFISGWYTVVQFLRSDRFLIRLHIDYIPSDDGDVDSLIPVRWIHSCDCSRRVRPWSITVFCSVEVLIISGDHHIHDSLSIHSWPFGHIVVVRWAENSFDCSFGTFIPDPTFWISLFLYKYVHHFTSADCSFDWWHSVFGRFDSIVPWISWSPLFYGVPGWCGDGPEFLRWNCWIRWVFTFSTTFGPYDHFGGDIPHSTIRSLAFHIPGPLRWCSTTFLISGPSFTGLFSLGISGISVFHWSVRYSFRSHYVSVHSHFTVCSHSTTFIYIPGPVHSICSFTCCGSPFGTDFLHFSAFPCSIILPIHTILISPTVFLVTFPSVGVHSWSHSVFFHSGHSTTLDSFVHAPLPTPFILLIWRWWNSSLTFPTFHLESPTFRHSHSFIQPSPVHSVRWCSFVRWVFLHSVSTFAIWYS
jgi:hypothetical protein